MGFTNIYGLVNESKKEIYVGKANNPESRFRDHLKDEGNYRKGRWIQNLKKKNTLPELVILEQTSLMGWQEREKFWIQYYKDLGWTLINNTKGGDGGDTNYTRKFKGKTLEERYGKRKAKKIKEKISKKLMGRQRPQEEKDKIKRAMIGRTHTWGDKISKAKMGHSVSKEQREKFSKTMKAKGLPGNSGSWAKGHVPWNKGLTKETNGVVKKYSEKVSNMLSTRPWSEKRRQAYLNRKVVLLGV